MASYPTCNSWFDYGISFSHAAVVKMSWSNLLPRSYVILKDFPHLIYSFSTCYTYMLWNSSPIFIFSEAAKLEIEAPLVNRDNGRPKRRSAMNSLYYHSSLQLTSYKLTKQSQQAAMMVLVSCSLGYMHCNFHVCTALTELRFAFGISPRHSWTDKIIYIIKNA